MKTLRLLATIGLGTTPLAAQDLILTNAHIVDPARKSGSICAASG